MGLAKNHHPLAGLTEGDRLPLMVRRNTLTRSCGRSRLPLMVSRHPITADCRPFPHVLGCLGHVRHVETSQQLADLTLPPGYLRQPLVALPVGRHAPLTHGLRTLQPILSRLGRLRHVETSQQLADLTLPPGYLRQPLTGILGRPGPPATAGRRTLAGIPLTNSAPLMVGRHPLTAVRGGSGPPLTLSCGTVGKSGLKIIHEGLHFLYKRHFLSPSKHDIDHALPLAQANSEASKECPASRRPAGAFRLDRDRKQISLRVQRTGVGLP